MTSEENPPIEKPRDWSVDDLPEASLADDLAKDPADPSSTNSPQGSGQADDGADLIEAEIVDQCVVEASIVKSEDSRGVSDAAVDTIPPPPIPKHLQNISANGGSVGAIVLGVWSLLGSLMTSWSVINALLGLLLGFWGVTSQRPRLAWIGIVLCLISMFFSMIQVSEFVGRLLKTTYEI